MTLDCTWVLDIHLNTGVGKVMLTATVRSAQTIHFEPLELLTVAAVREGVERLIARHGRPHAIATDHGAIWAGLGSAIGVPQRHPSQPTSDAWIERLARRVAA